MQAFRGEVERLIPPLRSCARALVSEHHPDVADELLRDVIAQALRAEHVGSGEEVAVRLFARLIGANRNRLRAECGERRSAPGGLVQTDLKFVGRTAARDRSSFAPDGVARSLDGLPLSHREALVLVVLGRLDHAHAAQVLGVPVGTLVTRVIHARDALGRSFMEPVGQRPGLAGVGGQRSVPHLRLVKS